MSDDGSKSDEIDLLAAEYVLGTLDYRERASFVERLRSDADARGAVVIWERRLDGLIDAVTPVQPPAEVWGRVERAIGTSAVRPFRVVEGGGGGPSTRHGTLERSRNRWRLGALSSGLVAAALALVLVGREGAPSAPPSTSDGRFIAAVNRGGVKPALIVTVDLKTRRVTISPLATEAPTGHSLQLWYIADGETPRSMGLVDAGSRELPPAISAAEGRPATIAVSVEPPGGSRTGGPTGPVVYSGPLIKE